MPGYKSQDPVVLALKKDFPGAEAGFYHAFIQHFDPRSGEKISPPRKGEKRFDPATGKELHGRGIGSVALVRFPDGDIIKGVTVCSGNDIFSRRIGRKRAIEPAIELHRHPLIQAVFDHGAIREVSNTEISKMDSRRRRKILFGRQSESAIRQVFPAHDELAVGGETSATKTRPRKATRNTALFTEQDQKIIGALQRRAASNGAAVQPPAPDPNAIDF